MGAFVGREQVVDSFAGGWEVSVTWGVVAESLSVTVVCCALGGRLPSLVGNTLAFSAPGFWFRTGSFEWWLLDPGLLQRREQ